MAGYLGSRPVIVQVDGYQREESESRYVNVSGDDFSGHLDFVDDAKARFGSSDELHIYTESSGSGHSYIQGDNIVIRSAAGTARLTVTSNDVDVSSGALKVGGSTVIDSSRNMLNVGTFSSTGQLQVTNGSITLTGGYNVQWGTGYANGDPAIWGNTTASALRFAPTGSTDGVVVEVDATGLDVAVGGLSVGGTTVINSSRGGALTGLSVATPSLSTDEALYIQNNPATAASNTARIRLAQSSNNAGTVLKLEHNRSNPTGSKMIDATVNHVGTPYNVFSVYGQGRTTVGSYAAANPVGTAINDAQLNVFHPTALGTSTGDDLKLLQVSGHSGNQSALTIRQRRMSNGNTWISDGFSITQDVDNTEAVYTYMYLHDGNVETANNLGVKGVPSAPLHVHGGGSNPGVIVESNTTTGAWVAMRTGQTSGEHFKVGTNATGFHVYNETDAATRLHISKSGGNVGIGNTDTDYKLSVGDTATYNYLQIQGANSNVMGGVRFKHHGGGGRTGVAKEWIISHGSDQTQFNTGVSSSAGVGGLVFWAVETGAANIDAMRLKNDGNAIFGYNVGINVSDPSARLDISAPSSTAFGTQALKVRDGSYTTIQMDSGAADGRIQVGAAGTLRGVYKAQHAGTQTDHPFSLIQDNSSRLTIRDDRSVAHIDSGYRFDLGFFPAPSNTYQHFKTDVQKANYMVFFEYKGYSYSSDGAVLTAMTVYTYTGSGGPYDPRYTRYGHNTANGFVNSYYSSDGYLVLVLKTGHTNGYTGGWMWAQSGNSFTDSNIRMLAQTSTSSNSGAY